MDRIICKNAIKDLIRHQWSRLIADLMMQSIEKKEKSMLDLLKEILNIDFDVKEYVIEKFIDQTYLFRHINFLKTRAKNQKSHSKTKQ
jgi:hypothetical protein